MMREARVSERSDLDKGEAEARRSDELMDVAMEIPTVATPSAGETASTTLFELMERNENGQRSRRSRAQATAMAPSH
jgi:hypothetical protein